LFSPENKPIQEAEKLILLAVSEIKNKGSGWQQQEFSWGKSPILLKSLVVDIKIETADNDKIKVYALDNKGSRSKEIPTLYIDNKASFSTEESKTLWFEITAE